MKVIVTTCQKYHWALRPFSYLFNVYWSKLQPVTILTDNRINIQLPPNFGVDVRKYNERPRQSQWSTMLIDYLSDIEDKNIVLMMDDYWLVRTVDNTGISTLYDYANTQDDILRIDLTDDRQYNGMAKNIGYWGHYDLLETPFDSPYQLSLQVGIWNREKLLSILRRGMTPWEVELYLAQDTLGDKPEMRVIGTRQCLIRYANVFKGGNPNELRSDQVAKIPQEHVTEMERLGYLR